MKTNEIMFRKTFCPKKRSMLFSRKIPFHNAARLTRRCVLFATIYHYPPLFTTVRTIHYSPLFAIQVFQTPHFISIPLPCLYVCVGLGDNKFIMWCN